MTICTHTHSFWAGIATQCSRCGQTKPARKLGLPSDLSVEQVKEFFSLPDDDDRMHGERRRYAEGSALTEAERRRTRDV
jgi:hypothetical protein